MEWDHWEKGLPPLASSSVVRVWALSSEAGLEHAGRYRPGLTSKPDFFGELLDTGLKSKD